MQEDLILQRDQEKEEMIQKKKLKFLKEYEDS